MTDPRLRHSLHHSINSLPYYATSEAQSSLQASCKNSLDFVRRMAQMNTLNVHSGCVNTVNWNASGTHIVSGSDDNYLVITELKSGRVAVKTKTLHKRHIFSARFMPFSNDQAIVSCSGEGIVIHTELLAPYGRGRKMHEAMIGESGRNSHYFDCHAFGSTYDVLPLPDIPSTFLSCGEDGTVRCIDLRVTSRCTEAVCDRHIFITAPCAVTAMDMAPISHYNLAVGCSDSIVRIYDRRMLNTCTDRERITWPLRAYPIPMKYTRRHYRPTCIKYSADESELLVSYSMDQMYLFNLKHPGFNDIELLKTGCYTPKLRRDDDPEPQMPRLRFRGDWSDTGPNSMAMAERGLHRLGQARPPLEPGVLSRLSDEILRMLNSSTRQSRGASSTSSTRSTSASGRRTGHMTWQDAIIRTLDMQSETATSRTINAQLLSRVRNSANLPAVANLAGVAPIVPDEEAASEVKSIGGEHQLKDFDYIKQSFSGHRNSRTMVKSACFWGDNFVMSGSDCGHIFVWDRKTGEAIKTMLADHRVVNRVQPHPTLPYLLSSGIDYNVKVWAPLAPVATFDPAETAGLIKNNAIMLVETRDTITVPAQIMIRILASLHQYRRLMSSNGNPTERPSRTPARTPRAELMDVVMQATGDSAARERSRRSRNRVQLPRVDPAPPVDEPQVEAMETDARVVAVAEGGDNNANDNDIEIDNENDIVIEDSNSDSNRNSSNSN